MYRDGLQYFVLPNDNFVRDWMSMPAITLCHESPANNIIGKLINNLIKLYYYCVKIH